MWEVKRLEECIEKVQYPNKIPKKLFLSEGQYPVISQEEAFINGYWNESTDLFSVASPLVIYGDHTQHVKYVDFSFVIGADGVKILQPKTFLNPRYFYYFLSSNPVDSLGYARHYRLLKTIQIPLPPLQEQKRIVAILDEAFAGIDQAIENTEKAKTASQEMFNSSLNAIFTQRGEGWVEKKLVDVCESLHQGLNTAGEKIKFYNDGYPIIQTRNLDDGNINYIDKIKYMCMEDWLKYKEKYKPIIGDVFFTNIGTIGKTAVVNLEYDYLIHWNIFKITPKESINSYFLKSFLDCSTNKGFFQKQQKGGTVSFVTKKMLASLKVPLPPLNQQAQIIQKLDTLATQRDELVEKYTQKLAHLQELKQSLLQQAFSGKLTNIREDAA